MSDSSNGLASQAGQPHWVFICLLLIIINKKFPRVPPATVLKLLSAKEAPLAAMKAPWSLLEVFQLSWSVGRSHVPFP